MDAIVKLAAKELGMECVRADQLPDPGQITTQIIDRIIGAKMVVADLTGGNPNVHLRARRPLQVYVDWLCRIRRSAMSPIV